MLCTLCTQWGRVDNLSVISVTIAQLIVTSRAFEMRMGTIIAYTIYYILEYNILYYYIYIYTHTFTATVQLEDLTNLQIFALRLMKCQFFLFVCLQVPLAPSSVRYSCASELEYIKAYLVTRRQRLGFHYRS